METKTCLDFSKIGAVVKAVGAMAMNTEAMAEVTALEANTAADSPVKAKVVAPTPGRLAAWAVAKVAVPVDAAKVGVRVADAACSARAI